MAKRAEADAEILEQGQYDPETAATLARVETLTNVMDRIVTIPGTSITLGLDALIGLIPVVGDAIGQAVSTYIIWEAHRIGAPTWLKMRMGGNMLIDGFVGMIPFAGDAFDVAFRANVRNLHLLKAHLEKHGARPMKTVN
ncbi:MAG: DUF4112 domain-containing protein [Pseudomonadota bacterium]